MRRRLLLHLGDGHLLCHLSDALDRNMLTDRQRDMSALPSGTRM
jgi:hypothetical protein